MIEKLYFNSIYVVLKNSVLNKNTKQNVIVFFQDSIFKEKFESGGKIHVQTL